jgi:hypothetical protein
MVLVNVKVNNKRLHNHLPELRAHCHEPGVYPVHYGFKVVTLHRVWAFKQHKQLLQELRVNIELNLFLIDVLGNNDPE